MKKNLSLFFLILLYCCSIQTVSAQDTSPGLTTTEKTEVLNAVSKNLMELYVYPETGKKMADQLKINAKKGDYDLLKDPREFADKLSKDLFAVCKDKHFTMRYDPQWVKESKKEKPAKDKDSEMQKRRALEKIQNYGFKEARILDGNIGYLNLSRFADPTEAGTTAAATMNFFGHASALIIDLRNNGGGSANMVSLLASYFFDSNPRPLNDIYWRPTNETFSMKTLAALEGKRMPDCPVYVLVSKSTFSAAEDFCYALKNLKRITLVGETTGGGAHPVMPVPIAERFLLNIPVGRSISSVTKTDWEGTGVKPDLEVQQKEALTTARRHALEQLLSKEPNNYLLNWALLSLKAEMQPEQTDAQLLKSYTGTYGEGKITFENGHLNFERPNRVIQVLSPVGSDRFHIENFPYFEMRFNRKNNQIVSMTRLYDDGGIFTDLLKP
jgi:hypothetical protein